MIYEEYSVSGLWTLDQFGILPFEPHGSVARHVQNRVLMFEAYKLDIQNNPLELNAILTEILLSQKHCLWRHPGQLGMASFALNLPLCETDIRWTTLIETEVR